MDTLGHLLTLRVTSADQQDRPGQDAGQGRAEGHGQVGAGLAFVDQGYTGNRPASDARTHGIELSVVKLPQAKRGLVLLPRRWVVERSFAWAARFQRLAKDYERLPTTLAGLHLVVLACLMLHNRLGQSP